MGEFSKQILTSYIDNDCERQLFLNLGKKDPRWISPLEEIEKLVSIRRGPPGQATEFGKKYEQEVYRSLMNLPGSNFNLTPNNKVVFRLLKRTDFVDIYNKFQIDKKTQIYLEAGISVPRSFFEELFDLNADEKIPMTDEKGNAKRIDSKIYPDVMILGLKGNNKLDENGTVVPVSMKDNDKIAINLFDIKKASEEAIGKKQFIEIVYYQLLFHHYLKENGLLDKFYINIDNNGIFPGFDNLYLYNIQDFLDKVIMVVWNEIYRLLKKSLAKVKSLWQNSPMKIESTETNIKSQCGRCDYYDDCFKREGGRGNAKNMSVKLIPYTSMSIVEQLNVNNIYTLDDLVNKLDDIQVGNVPKPIYAEIPKLRLKGKSLASKQRVIPTEGEIMSVAIPKYNDISIVINLEMDPLHNRVFGASLLFNSAVSKFSKFKLKYEKWWTVWDELLNKQIDKITLRERLENEVDIRIERSDFKEIYRIMKELKSAGAEIKIAGKEYTKNNGDKYTSNITSINYLEGFVNEGLDENDEYELTKTLVQMVYKFISLSTYIERYVVAITLEENYKGEEREVHYYPSTGVYYWSQEIMEILQDLLQRQLSNLLVDKDLNFVIAYLIKWFTPSESMVQQSEQMKKIFDLRQFVETTQGLPNVINYTWHGVYENLTGYEAHKNYYSLHFNYMDHNVWYGFLQAKESSADILTGKKKSRSQHRDDLIKQLKSKVRTIFTLKNHFQSESRKLISKENYRPANSLDLIKPKVPSTYHDIARIWFLYSRLTGAVSELEASQFRYMYPEYSIGKLAAAEVSNLRIYTIDKGKYKEKYVYKFRIEGLSSNMKLKPKSQVLLLPVELRDYGGGKWKWTVTIDTMEWDDANNAYDIKTEESSSDLFLDFKNTIKEDKIPEKWYLYPKGADYWTNKLDILLASFNIGRSWFGHRLSYLLGITPNPPINASENANIREIYMYHPTLLDSCPIPLYNSLVTDVKFPPNPSQEKAILNSMNNIISSIQGPPGTGKSQTVVALIDEFIKRSHSSVKILITSFSYQALNVLVDKVSESVDNDGNPTDVAKLPRVYLHSGAKSPHPNANNLTVKGTTWSLNGITGRKEGIGAKGRNLETEFPSGFIMFGVAHQLTKLNMRKRGSSELYVIHEDFAFDLIIVDESSQMPIDQILASLQYIRDKEMTLINLPSDDSAESREELDKIEVEIDHPENLTKLVLVGDSFQLPPVQPVSVPLKLESVLGSLFTYYIVYQGVSNQPLETNYRSHEIIVEYTKRLGFYQNLVADTSVAKRLLPGDFSKISDTIIKEILDPSKIVSTIIHDHRFETAVSMIEAQITTDIFIAFYEMINPQTKDEERGFFLEKVGVVAPHNAHGRLITRMVYEKLNTNYHLNLDDDELMYVLSKTIFSVEKFQGSDRNFIISTIGISSFDQLSAEEEFIYDVNRFNVLTSRAKNKMILICSRNFLEYFPKNKDVISHYSKITDYAYEYCNSIKKLNMLCEEHNQNEELEFRYRV